jgi:hypothetical protein
MLTLFVVPQIPRLVCLDQLVAAWVSACDRAGGDDWCPLLAGLLVLLVVASGGAAAAGDVVA